MKFFKIIVSSILFVLLTCYLAFLFVLPSIIDFEKYAPQFEKLFEDQTSTKAEFTDLKIKTNWDLSLVASSEKINLKNEKNEKFAQINGIKIKLSLIPLLMKKIKIDEINANKILANIDESTWGNNKKTSQKPSQFMFFSKMPNIFISKYRISFIDKKNTYSLKGSDFEVSDFILNEKIKLKSKGKLILNGKEQINYDLAIFSNVFPKPGKQNVTDYANLIKIFENIYKYKIKANITTNLKIKEGDESPDINGKLNFDKLSLTFGEKLFPPSSLKLVFKGNKAKINASLHVDATSKALITGIFRTGKNKSIDLHVISDKIHIEDVFSIIKTLAMPLNLKELQNVDAKGLLKANFDIKSNFKQIESNGYLKIKNASIIHKAYKISADSINADIDFSQNSIKIKQATALLNSQPITINGAIDKNAIADISVLAKNLQLKSVLFTFGQLKILKENDILSGLVNLNLKLNGQLAKTSPKTNVIVSNVNLKNKKSKTQVKIAQIIINSDLKEKNTAKITGLKISQKNQSTISIPKLNLIFNEKELNLEKTQLYMNNIKANLTGKISNLSTEPTLNPLSLSIPNQMSFPIEGYANSKILVKGNINLIGELYNPKILGNITIPLISIPSMSTAMRNITLTADKEISLNCPEIKTVNSLMSFSAQINKDFSKGIIAQNAKLTADKIDLNALGGILKTIQVGTGPNITILNGRNTIGIFKVGTVIANNITSDISLKNNVLSLNNLRGDAYFGKIAGDINYYLNNKKTSLKLQGRELSANLAMTGLTGRNDDINGKLDFDSNIDFIGHSKDELLRTLKGNTTFIITNGKMGVLGKFEHLIYAQNVLSNSIFRATINLAAKAVTVKNTGVYRYMKGEISLSNGIAHILRIKSSGPSMSLYMKGRYYLLDNNANITILGRISDDVVNILGPIGEFSMNKMISTIPKLGQVTNSLIDQYTTDRNYENISQIPPLTIQTHFPTKEFKVVINGDIQKQSAVKSFKWLAKPQAVQQPKQGYTPTQQSQNNSNTQTPTNIPDFVKNLPDFKQ